MATVRPLRLFMMFLKALSIAEKSFCACWTGAAKVDAVRHASPRSDVKCIFLLVEERKLCRSCEEKI